MFVCAALNKKNNYFHFKYPVSNLVEADCTADLCPLKNRFKKSGHSGITLRVFSAKVLYH